MALAYSATPDPGDEMEHLVAELAAVTAERDEYRAQVDELRLVVQLMVAPAADHIDDRFFADIKALKSDLS